MYPSPPVTYSRFRAASKNRSSVSPTMGVEPTTFSGCRVVDQHDRRVATADEEPMIRFIQGHRIVRPRVRDRPRGHQLHCRAIEDGDVVRVGNVHEDTRAVALQLKRLRMSLELHLACSPSIEIDRGNGP